MGGKEYELPTEHFISFEVTTILTQGEHDRTGGPYYK